MNLKKILSLLILIPIGAFSGVNLKNGNFYINYFDVIVPGGGKNLEISRTYNSKATTVGWFGFGWGSDFETSLMVSADQTVIITENGSGARTRFVPQTLVKAEEAADKIMKKMRKKTKLNDKLAKTMKDKLIKDAALRQAYEKRYKVKGDIKTGAILYSNTRGLQKVIKTANGYLRSQGDGKKQYFDREGKLTKIEDSHNYKIFFKYDGTQLRMIKDSQGKQLTFEWTSKGKVKKITTTGGRVATYKYKKHNLIESKDIGNNVYKYTYDGNHNMTSVIYQDGEKMEIAYTPKSQFVKEIKSRNGDYSKYSYESNPENPALHYWTYVSKGIGENEITNKYEYELKTRPDGSQYQYRILTDIDGFKSETVYSECCQAPLKIDRGGEVTTFEYNPQGLLVRKNLSDGSFIKLEYDELLNKISKVTNKKGWTKFTYDKKGNLQGAENQDGKAVLLIYDRHGRINKMVDYDALEKKKRSLSFKYNAAGKPIEIAMSNVGKINVVYDRFGDIKEVKSKAGSQMAAQVTKAFKNLLSIVRPAGVNLNM